MSDIQTAVLIAASIAFVASLGWFFYAEWRKNWPALLVTVVVIAAATAAKQFS